MAKPGLADVRSLPDPMQSQNFALFTNVPSPGGNSRRLTLQCQQAPLTGISNDQVTVGLHGVEVMYQGRPMFEKTASLSFIETRDTVIRDTIRGWIEFARNARNNTGNYKKDYESTGDLVLYDDQYRPVKTVRHYGFYPNNMSEVSLDGSSSGTVLISVTFLFDFTSE